MVALLQKMLSSTLIVLLIVLTPQSSISQHIVTSNELQQAVADHSAQREANIVKVTNFLSSEGAIETMKQMNADPVKVTRAVSTLSDEELAGLASRVDTAERQLAAGYHMSSHELITLLIIVVLVIAIVVIVQEVD